jgi:hypothetical protein
VDVEPATLETLPVPANVELLKQVCGHQKMNSTALGIGALS